MRVLFNEIICYGCKAFIVSGFCVDVQYSLFETKSVKYTYCDVTFMLQNSPLASSLKPVPSFLQHTVPDYHHRADRISDCHIHCNAQYWPPLNYRIWIVDIDMDNRIVTIYIHVVYICVIQHNRLVAVAVVE